MIKIGNFEIGRDRKPFVIAEMSGNHNQSLDRALKIVETAAEAGAHAMKLQTYTAQTMTIDIREREFMIRDEKSLWKGNSLFELYEKAHTPWEWHEPIFRRCKELGMVGFSTPFDPTAVDFLERLNVPCYKIASFEMTDWALLRRVAETGKPVIVSTGMASLPEVFESVAVLRKHGCKDLILLKCTSAYPADPSHINLASLPLMNEIFGCEVGLSDHTMGIGVSVASVALGACVVEKHFTLSRQEGGVDAAFSLEPNELRDLVSETEKAWKALGKARFEMSSSEEGSIQFRRSLYVVEDMQPGEVFTEKNLRAIRPGFGLPPKHYEFFLGKHVAQPIRRGTPLAWDHLIKGGSQR